MEITSPTRIAGSLPAPRLKAAHGTIAGPFIRASSRPTPPARHGVGSQAEPPTIESAVPTRTSARYRLERSSPASQHDRPFLRRLVLRLARPVFRQYGTRRGIFGGRDGSRLKRERGRAHSPTQPIGGPSLCAAGSSSTANAHATDRTYGPSRHNRHRAAISAPADR